MRQLFIKACLNFEKCSTFYMSIFLMMTYSIQPFLSGNDIPWWLSESGISQILKEKVFKLIEFGEILDYSQFVEKSILRNTIKDFWLEFYPRIPSDTKCLAHI